MDEPLTPQPAVTAPEAATKVMPAPKEVEDWRSHIFFFWLSIVGTVGTLIGILLGIYFYQASQIKPLLTFSVHPLKTELQRPDYDKELGFIYKGNPVDSESITSVQVSVWNAGTKSIRDTDILEPFRLVMPDGAAVLSARVKKTTRDICVFERIDKQEDYKRGLVGLKWRILEPGDGAVVQIIYAGNARNDPKLQGTIEGQKDGIVVEQYGPNTRRTLMEEFIPSARYKPIWVLCASGLFLFCLAEFIRGRTEAARRRRREMKKAIRHLNELRNKAMPSSPVYWALWTVALCLVLAGTVILLFGAPHGPPFGW